MGAESVTEVSPAAGSLTIVSAVVMKLQPARLTLTLTYFWAEAGVWSRSTT